MSQRRTLLGISNPIISIIDRGSFFIFFFPFRVKVLVFKPLSKFKYMRRAEYGMKYPRTHEQKQEAKHVTPRPNYLIDGISVNQGTLPIYISSIRHATRHIKTYFPPRTPFLSPFPPSNKKPKAESVSRSFHPPYPHPHPHPHPNPSSSPIRDSAHPHKRPLSSPPTSHHDPIPIPCDSPCFLLPRFWYLLSCPPSISSNLQPLVSVPFSPPHLRVPLSNASLSSPEERTRRARSDVGREGVIPIEAERDVVRM